MKPGNEKPLNRHTAKIQLQAQWRAKVYEYVSSQIHVHNRWQTELRQSSVDLKQYD